MKKMNFGKLDCTDEKDIKDMEQALKEKFEKENKTSEHQSKSA